MVEQEKPKGTLCPNCQQPAVKVGNEITCENCDAIFEITRKQGPKLKQLGPIEDLRDRVENLEALVNPEKPAEQPAEPADPESEEIEETEQGNESLL